MDGLPKPESGGGDSLVFRRFYLYVIDNKMALGHGIANVLFYLCQRQHLDAVVFHIPSDVELRTIRPNQWISKTEFRILADNVGLRLEGEYIKGDFFIDVTAQTRKSLLQVINSEKISFEFGPADERLEIYQADAMPDGKGNLKGFLREALPMMLKSVGGTNLRHLNDQQMLKACAGFKASKR